MPDIQWIPGPSQLELTNQQVEQIIALFLNETDERYAEASVRHLPIPVWNGNLLLFDMDEPDPKTVQGVLWTTPFKDDIVRVAAFVISKSHQGQGFGGRGWTRFEREAWGKGFRRVQLEVKAENQGAQRFYAMRGMRIQQSLEGYYQSGLGYMMRGPLRHRPQHE